MADNPFDRTIIRPLEKPLCDDVNQGFSQMDRGIRDAMFNLLRGRQGFLNTGFLVVQQSPAAMSVVLKAGIGWQDAPADVPTAIDSVVGLDDLSRYKPIILVNDLTIAVPVAPGANSRIDLLEVRYDRRVNNLQSRNFLNTTTNAFAPANVNKTLDFTVDGTLAYYAAAATPTTALAYKSGVVSGSPSPPATDTGYLPLAYITVGTGVTTIVTANIQVLRSVIGGSEFLGRQKFTSSGTYTPTPGTTKVRIQVVGGGGGSGGLTGTSNENTVSPGGASAIYVEKFIDGLGIPITGGAVVVGAAGAAGGTNAAGGAGGNSSIVINGTTWTSAGGPGGIAGTTTGATDVGTNATATAGGSSVGDVNDGSAGGGSFATRTADGRMHLGNGGSNPLGHGGAGSTGAAGIAGTGYGSGGGGIGIASVGNKNGGAGAPGVVFVEEWT